MTEWHKMGEHPRTKESDGADLLIELIVEKCNGNDQPQEYLNFRRLSNSQQRGHLLFGRGICLSRRLRGLGGLLSSRSRLCLSFALHGFCGCRFHRLHGLRQLLQNTHPRILQMSPLIHSRGSQHWTHAHTAATNKGRRAPAPRRPRAGP